MYILVESCACDKFLKCAVHCLVKFKFNKTSELHSKDTVSFPAERAMKRECHETSEMRFFVNGFMKYYWPS